MESATPRHRVAHSKRDSDPRAEGNTTASVLMTLRLQKTSNSTGAADTATPRIQRKSFFLSASFGKSALCSVEATLSLWNAAAGEKITFNARIITANHSITFRTSVAPRRSGCGPSTVLAERARTRPVRHRVESHFENNSGETATGPLHTDFVQLELRCCANRGVSQSRSRALQRE